jgi:hypothetical protein
VAQRAALELETRLHAIEAKALAATLITKEC